MLTKHCLTAFGFIWFVALATISGSANALTPDGVTPANEGVCDVVMGGSPGLYGLCVAYCEAQDLDDFEKEPPRTKILENYVKKQQPGDPDMPCIQPDCPCWNATELASVSDSGSICTEFSTTKTQTRSTLSGDFHLADADTNPINNTSTPARCRYFDNGVGTGLPPTVRSQRISIEKATVCLAEIRAACGL